MLDDAAHAESVIGSSGEIDLLVRGDDVVSPTTLAWMTQVQRMLLRRFGDDLRPVVSAPTLLGFLGRADRVSERVVLAIADTGHALIIDDGVGSGSSDDAATATFDGPTEAALRLITGRLGPSHTPATVAVTGNVTLDQLREVFPGF